MSEDTPKDAVLETTVQGEPVEANEVCPLSDEEHIDRLLKMFVLTGLGGCKQTVQALENLVAFFKREREYTEEFVGDATKVEQSLARLEAERQRMIAAYQQKMLEEMDPGKMAQA